MTFCYPVPIINIPEFGDLSAIKACQDLKVKSQNDRLQLEQAKDLVYTKGNLALPFKQLKPNVISHSLLHTGFYDGVMIVGEHKGMKVKEAKPLIKDSLMKQGLAVAYSEPAGRVMSRSGDECVVALKDQWYMNYGEKDWRAQTEAYVHLPLLFPLFTSFIPHRL